MRSTLISIIACAAAALPLADRALAQDYGQYSENPNSLYQQNRQTMLMLQQMDEKQMQDELRFRQSQQQGTSGGLSVGETVVGLGAAWVIWCVVTDCLSKAPKQSAGAPVVDHGDDGNAPELGQTPVAPPASVPTYRVVRTPRWDVLNMRQGPGIRHQILSGIPSTGRGIEVETCQANELRESWCLARYGATRGWVSSQYIAVE